MTFYSHKRRVATIFAGAVLTALLSMAPPASAQERGKDDRDHQQQQEKAEYHFRPEHKDQFSSHYKSQIRDVQKHADRRQHINAGEQLPSDYRSRLKAVPRSYYRNVPPPPPGYQFGYYDGYVVAYNPTTRVVADVLDLVDAAVHH